MKIKRFNESAEYGEDFIKETFLWFEDNFKTEYDLDNEREIGKSIRISFHIEDISEYEEVMSEYLKSLNLLKKVYKVHDQHIHFSDDHIDFHINFSMKLTLEEFKKRFLKKDKDNEDTNYLYYYVNENRVFNVNQPSIQLAENYFKLTIHEDQIKSFDEKYPNEEDRIEQYTNAVGKGPRSTNPNHKFVELHIYSYRYTPRTLDMILGIIEGKF